MSTILENLWNEKQLENRVIAFFNTNKVGNIMSKARAYTSGGIPVMQIMLYLVQLVFTKKSMYMNQRNGTNNPGFCRDVVYRFMNNMYINWSFFLLTLAISVIKPIKTATTESRLCAIVVDDTFFDRCRSKCVELLANVHDHAAKHGNKFKRGFRMLTMGWTDGVTFIPLMFRHMSSTEKKNRYNEINPNIDKRSSGYKARFQAISKATDVLLWMLGETKQVGVPAKHVLFDSWFSYPVTIIEIKKLDYFVVGMLKNTKTIKYIDNGKRKTLKEILDSNKKRPGKAKYLLSAAVELYNDKNETIPARIVYIRDRRNSKKWLALISTDMSLAEEEIISLYGKRWDIEVFFKICKSYLKLSREFQGLSYDMITAHSAIVMTRYILLASDIRHGEDPRTMTELFHSCYDELPDKNFSQALSIILECLHEALGEGLFLSEHEIDALIEIFISKVSDKFRQYLVKNKSA